MSEYKFRHPSEMTRDEREPVSTRIKTSTKEILEKAANKYGLSLASLLSNVLEDYAEWLESHPKK